ncbi:hypothetical protein N665_0876s0007, partial [Sinapis alba]
MEKFEALSDHVKRLDGQIGNNAVNIRREKGFLPRRTDIKPKSQVNIVTLRSGRHLNQNVKEGITIDEFVGIKHAEKDDSHPILVDTPEESPDTNTALIGTHKVSTVILMLSIDTRVYVPKTPFSQSQSTVICKKIFDKIIVEIPLGVAIKIAPAIKKYLKDAVTKGFETTKYHVTMVGKDKSAEIQGNKTAKLQDPSSFFLDCNIHSEQFQRSLCDIGSYVNLMPYSVAKALGLTEFKPTRITLILADRSVRVPECILEDVPIKINDCVIPADFVVLKYDNEPKDPLILGMLFLATAGAIIAVKEGRICLNIEDITMAFDMEKLVKKPLIDGQTYAVDYLSELADESFMDVSSNYPLERTLTTHEVEIFSIDDRADKFARLLDAAEG